MSPTLWHEGEYWLRKEGWSIEQPCAWDSPAFDLLEEAERATLLRVLSLVMNEPGFVAPHHHLLRTYHNTFVGCDFVSLLIKHKAAPGREEAVALGKRLCASVSFT